MNKKKRKRRGRKVPGLVVAATYLTVTTSAAAGAGYLLGVPNPSPSTCLYQLQSQPKFL